MLRSKFASGQSRFVAVNGGMTHYQLFNPEDIAKPGLLFVHGMWAHLHWWDHIVPYFVDRFRVVSMDLGGMGDSEIKPTYTAAGFGEEIIAVLEHANIAPANVVAHSFGGAPAVFACHLRPELIGRAVIIDSCLYLPVMPDLPPHEVQHLKIKRKIYEQRQDAINRYRLIPLGGTVAPDILRHIASTGLGKEKNGWAWKFDPAIDPQLDNDPNRIIPSDIGTPIDYIFGDNSEVVSHALADAIGDYLPGCGAPIAIPGGNHHILLEQPDLLVTTLRALFSRM